MIAIDQDRGRLLDDVEAFCEELRPHEELCYLEHTYNADALKLAIKHDLLGIAMPVALGGRGCDFGQFIKAIVRIGREGTGVRTLFSGHTAIGQMPILRFGSDRQKEKYIRPSCSGEKILAFALTEPEAGSNPLEMQTTYEKTSAGYLLTGIKYLISNGSIANAIVTFAYPPNREGRLSAFIIDTASEGFLAEELVAKIGLPTSNTAMFEMNRLEVPEENLLGTPGDGFKVAMDTLVSGRLSVAGGCLGVIEDCLISAVEYARERSQHGKLIGRHQLVQDHLAQIEIERQATESFLHTAVTARLASDANPEDVELKKKSDLLAAQVKYFASNAAWDAADRAVQVLGGRGYSELYRPGRHLKDVRVCRLYEGTDEIIKLKVASQLLGKEFEAFK